MQNANASMHGSQSRSESGPRSGSRSESGSESSSRSPSQTLPSRFPFQSLEIYVAARELARLVHQAGIGDDARSAARELQRARQPRDAKRAAAPHPTLSPLRGGEGDAK
jgi:hypothetical protein